MKRTNVLVTLALALNLTGCGGKSPGQEHGHEHEEGAGHDDHAGSDAPGHEEGHGEAHGHGHSSPGDLPGTTLTHFTRSLQDQSETELFVEFGPLIVGTQTSFAAHLTDCGELWTAIGAGQLGVELTGGEGAEERFVVDKPAVPGIFRPVATPAVAGKRTLRFRLSRGGRVHLHDVGEVLVHTDQAAAEKALGQDVEEAEGASISFLKEQAWKLDFALAEVKKQAVSPTLRVYGNLVPRSEAQAQVSAPASGRLVATAAGFPAVGTHVGRGTTLAYLVPSVSGGGNLAAIVLRKEKATLALGTAKRELERAAGLVEQGAVPARRVQDAEAKVARAQADIAGADRLLAQHHGSVSGGRAPGGMKILAPIGGVVTAVPVVAGAHVEDGATLFSLVDTAALWMSAGIPESQRDRARVVYGGSFRTSDGVWRALPASEEGYKLTSVLNHDDRTFPLRIPLDNHDGELASGTHVLADLSIAAPSPVMTVARSAVVYEQGVSVVYVMTEGESFERRVVKLRGEVGPLSIVEEGVQPGERIVSVGAMYLKLTSMGGGAPAHGHAH